MKRISILLILVAFGSTTLTTSPKLNATTGVTIQEGTTVELREGTSLKLPAGSVLQVNTGGTFKTTGASGNNAVITHSEAGTYTVNIEGNVNCQYFTFEYMDANGVKLKTNGSIDFNNGTLQQGTADGTLLWLECTGETFDNIAFFQSGVSPLYNVKTVNDDPNVGCEANECFNFTFTGGAMGDYANDLHDNDPGDINPGEGGSQGWIIWGGPYATELIGFEAIAGWEEVFLRWVSEVEINTEKYIIERSLKEDDGFELIKEVPAKGVGGTYSYLDKEVVSEMPYWYKLIAVDADSSRKSLGPVKATPNKCKVFTLVLLQNVPNPFNRENGTRIEFSVPGKSPGKSKFSVSLAVYDLSGGKMCELMDGEYPPGWYSVSWEPKGVSKGIYFYRLQVGEKYLGKKLIVY